MADTLTKQEKALRQRFVAEYLADYDSVGAAIRLGYQEAFAQQYAKQFLAEPYTLKLIKEREAEFGILTEEDQHRKKIVAGLYREAHSRVNSGSARVAALTQLAKVIGIEAPVKSEVKLTETEHDMSHLTLEEKLAIKKKLYPNAP
jgi:phage terminase small subunit